MAYRMAVFGLIGGSLGLVWFAVAAGMRWQTAMLFLGILFVVGVDVGLNTTIPKLLQERCHLPLGEAGYGTSLYFIARTLGAFLGAFILARVSGRSFYMLSMIIAIVAVAFLFVTGDLLTVRILIFILGISVANVFPIIFSAALKHKPDQFNEILPVVKSSHRLNAFCVLCCAVPPNKSDLTFALRSYVHGELVEP
jgi:fucose permease